MHVGQITSLTPVYLPNKQTKSDIILPPPRLEDLTNRKRLCKYSLNCVQVWWHKWYQTLFQSHSMQVKNAETRPEFFN